MKLRWLANALVAVVSMTGLQAVAYDRPPVQRNRDGTINRAPRPGAFVVVSVDSYNRTVRLRAHNGAQDDVYVGDGIYDLSRLKAGDRIRVDFLVPDDVTRRLAAATIWPVR